jgi:hypothetical protein
VSTVSSDRQRIFLARAKIIRLDVVDCEAGTVDSTSGSYPGQIARGRKTISSDKIEIIMLSLRYRGILHSRKWLKRTAEWLLAEVGRVVGLALLTNEKVI